MATVLGTSSRDIALIAEALEQGQIGFLFGAGMSVASGGLPSRELAYQILRKTEFADVKDDDVVAKARIQEIAAEYPLEALAQGVELTLPTMHEGLISLLRKAIFGDDEPKPHNGHKRLGTIINRWQTMKMIFTTNWDNLLEDGIGSSAKTVSIQNAEVTLYHLYEILQQKTAVIHLHGTFDDTPLICEKDLIDPERPLFQLFLGELLSKSFVFVGYSLSDPNIHALYSRARDLLTKRDKTLGKKSYVVFPPRDDFDYRVSNAVWRQRGATYIPLTAEEFFERLYNELDTRVLAALRGRVMRRLGMKTIEELNDKVAELVDVFPDFGNNVQVLLYLDSITRGRSE